MLLLTKAHTFSDCLFSPNVLLSSCCPRIPFRIPCYLMSSVFLGFSWLWEFLWLSLLLKLKILRSQIFCKISLRWECLTVRLSFWVWGKKTPKRIQVRCKVRFRHSVWRVHTVSVTSPCWCWPWPPLQQCPLAFSMEATLSPSFPHNTFLKDILTHSSHLRSGSYASLAPGQGIYRNHLDLFCLGDFSLLFHLFIQ